jgi:hypothetical protein
MKTLYLCEECNAVCRTGDYWFLWYIYNNDEAGDRYLRISLGIRALGPSIYSAYEELLGGIVTNSTAPCDCCMTRRKGDRFRYEK